MIEPVYECPCGHRGHADSWETKLYFAGNREEPPEWEAFCPNCGASWEEAIEKLFERFSREPR